jgi:hypothetical protein
MHGWLLHTTNVSFQGKGFHLVSLLKVSEAFSPLSYSLNGTVAGDETQITCTFQGSKVKERSVFTVWPIEFMTF